jgi:hypothetical protein
MSVLTMPDSPVLRQLFQDSVRLRSIRQSNTQQERSIISEHRLQLAGRQACQIRRMQEGVATAIQTHFTVDLRKNRNAVQTADNQH